MAASTELVKATEAEAKARWREIQRFQGRRGDWGAGPSRSASLCWFWVPRGFRSPLCPSLALPTCDLGACFRPTKPPLWPALTRAGGRLQSLCRDPSAAAPAPWGFSPHVALETKEPGHSRPGSLRNQLKGSAWSLGARKQREAGLEGADGSPATDAVNSGSTTY